MGPIKVKDYHDLVLDLLKKCGFGPEILKPVPSVFEWANAHGLAENNPFRVARAVTRKVNGKPFIVICQEITEDQKSSVLGGIKVRGLCSKAVQLNTEKKFLTHLILHEIGEILREIGQLTLPLKGETDLETELDKWAFAQMEIT